MAGPDHGRARRAERRQRVDRAHDVVVGDVAEHAARRARARPEPRPRTRSVSDASPQTHLDAGRCVGAGRVAVVRVELDEPGAHVGGAGMTVERADQVVALTGAQADDADRAGRAPRASAAPMWRCTIASRRWSELPGASYARCQATQSSPDRSFVRSLSRRAPSRSSRRPRALRAAPSARSARSRCRRGRRGTSRSSSGCRRCGPRRRRSAVSAW